jgi:hypothetical protein
MVSWSEELSENGRFQVRLEQYGEEPLHFKDSPPLADRKIQVFNVNGPQKKLVWSATTTPGSACGAIVSNDGRYVAIVDQSQRPEWDVVEVFCGGKGKTVAYSQDKLIRLAEQVEGIKLVHYIEPYLAAVAEVDDGGYAFRIRSSHAIFRKSGGRTHFCLGIWDGHEFGWLVCDAETGERIDVDEVFAAEILEDAHRRCREQIIKRQTFNLGFLVMLKRPEDRPLIEGLLDADDFHTAVIDGSYKEPALGWFFKKLGIRLEGTIELDFVYASSYTRSAADRALGRWDGKGRWSGSSRKTASYHYLGNVLVNIALPKKPKRRGGGGLWVYLVPDSVSRQQWLSQPPAHCLHVEFKSTDTRLKPGQTIPCVFRTAAPGRYWVKAVWDKAKPYHNGKDKFYRPRKGDYESVDSPVIEVKAEQTVDAGTIECKQKVKGN